MGRKRKCGVCEFMEEDVFGVVVLDFVVVVLVDEGGGV